MAGQRRKMHLEYNNKVKFAHYESSDCNIEQLYDCQPLVLLCKQFSLRFHE